MYCLLIFNIQNAITIIILSVAYNQKFVFCSDR